MEDKKTRNPWIIPGIIVGTVVVLVSAVVTTVAVMSMKQQAEAQIGDNSSTATTAQDEMPSTSIQDVWHETVPAAPTTPPPPVATNYTIDSVQYPLLETPEVTNPPDENPDMQIRFDDEPVLEGPEELKWICPLEFDGSTKLCVQTYTLTDTDDPYKASVILEVRSGVDSCKDFEDCFTALKRSSYCMSFVDYLDTLSRELASRGYNSFGLANLDPALVNLTYWDGNGDNRQIIIHDDCSIETVLH